MWWPDIFQINKRPKKQTPTLLFFAGAPHTGQPLSRPLSITTGIFKAPKFPPPCSRPPLPPRSAQLPLRAAPPSPGSGAASGTPPTPPASQGALTTVPGLRGGPLLPPAAAGRVLALACRCLQGHVPQGVQGTPPIPGSPSTAPTAAPGPHPQQQEPSPQPTDYKDFPHNPQLPPDPLHSSSLQDPRHLAPAPSSSRQLQHRGPPPHPPVHGATNFSPLQELSQYCCQGHRGQ